MASKLPPPNGVVLWQGASELDGAPLVVIATGLQSTGNVKTGSVIQTWIMRADISPVVAAETGDDFSVCGDCPSRGRIVDGENVDRACYVVLWQSPRSVWSTGHFTGEVPFMRGRVREVRCFADSRVPGQVPDLCVVDWDGGHESRVLACNLVRVDRLHLEPV